MKKFIAILLAAVMALAFTACSPINDKEVSILWSSLEDSYLAKLSNGINRAMYTENIKYTHYDAEGSRETQLEQAQKALDNGCAALAVNLVDINDAQAIIDMAKGKDIPVIVFASEVSEAVIASYEKCYAINTDEASLSYVKGEMIGSYILENFEAADRNKDGKISYISFGDETETVSVINDTILKAEADAEEKDKKEHIELVCCTADKAYENPEKANETLLTVFETHNDENNNTVELILTDSDSTALLVYEALRSKEFNHKKLTTHYIPVFTADGYADAKAFADTDGMKEEEKAEYIYTTTSLIDSGYLSGTVLEDYDSIAGALAVLSRNIIKGTEPFEGIDEKSVSSNKSVKVPYRTYTQS